MIRMIFLGYIQHRWLWSVFGQSDRVAAELLLELSSAVELWVGLLCETFRAQSEQLLQAVDQPLVLLLQLHAALQIISVGPDSTQSTIQLSLQGRDRHYQDLNVFACSFPKHVTKIQQLAHLQLCGLVDDSSRQVVSVGLLQQGAHLLHLLLQRLLHLNQRLEDTHTHTHTHTHTLWQLKNFTTAF